MTSLAKQLERLAVPVIQPVGGVDTRRVSLLFNPNEAANLDKEAVYCLGVSGVEVLERVDEAFSEYKSSLFSQSSQSWERTVQNSEANAKLDRIIHQFLVQASPYLQLKATHKALEWLIYRFHIHLFNVDDIIMCALPYHETKIFVRLLQLLKLENPTNKWHWLFNSSKSGTPLTLWTISSHCKKNPGFLSVICDLVPRFIKVHGPSSQQLGAVIALATTCLLAALQNKDDIDERMVSIIVPHLVTGFKTKCLDFCAGCYMVLGQLCTQMTLKVSVLNMLLPVLTKKIRPALAEEALQCLCVVFQTQRLDEMPKKSFKHLSKLQGLVQMITKLAQDFVITPFLKAFLLKLIPLACELTAMESFSNTEGSEDFGQGVPQYSSILLSIIQAVELPKDLSPIIARLLLGKLLEQRRRLSSDPQEINAWTDVTSQLLSSVERRYTADFDSAVEATYIDLGDDNPVVISYLRDMTAFTALPLKYLRVSGNDCSLTLCLNHAKKTVRLMGVKDLVSSLKESQATGDPYIEETLLARLADGEFEVVQEVFELKQQLGDLIGPEKLYPALLTVLERNSEICNRTDRLLVPVTLLLDHLETTLDLSLLLRLLVIVMITHKETTVVTATLAEMILEELLKRKIPMLQWPAKEWLRIQYTTTEPENQLIKELNNVLFKTLAENFVKADNVKEILETISLVCQDNKKATCLYLGVLTEMLQVSCLTTDCRYAVSRQLLDLMQTIPHKFKVKGALDGPTSPFSDHDDLLHSDGDQQISPHLLYWSLKHLSSSTAKFRVNELWPNVSHPHVKLQVDMLDFLTQKYYSASTEQSVWTKLLSHFVKMDLGRDKFLALCSCVWCDSSGTVSAQLCVGSFCLVEGLLSKCRDMLAPLVRQNKSVFPALITSLASESSNVRSAVLDLLTLIKDHGKDYVHIRLVKKLVKRAEEIQADPQHIPLVVGKFYGSESHKDSLKEFVKYMTADSTPLMVTNRLIAITASVPSQVMLSTLVQVGNHILDNLQSEEERGTRLCMLRHILARFDEESVSLIELESQALEFFIRCLKTSTVEYGDQSPAALAVRQLTKQFFHALPTSEVKQKLLSAVLDTILSSSDASFVSIATGKLRRVKLNASHVAVELNLEEPEELRTLRGHKRSRNCTGTKRIDYSRLTLLLEVMQARKKVKDGELLVTLMFKLLHRFIVASEEGSEYCKQLVLTLLHNQCTKWTDENKPKNQELLNAELLVQCLRSAHNNLHTQQQTLLVLSSLANLYPEYILHNIMSVFTFLGSSDSGLLQQEDSHSFQTITITMETLIPALIKAHSSDREQLQQHITQIIQVFVGARHHIPKHRSHVLFTRLLSAVGEEDFLWVLMVLIIESSVRGKDVPNVDEAADIVDKDKSHLDKDVDFASSICEEIPASVQVVTATKMLVFLQNMTALNQEGKGEVSLPPRLRRKQDKKRGFPINADTLTPQQLRLVQYTTTKMVAVMLSRESFLSLMVVELNRSDETFKQHFQTFVEASLAHLTRVSKAFGSHGNLPTCKFWKALFSKVSDIMDKVSYLMPGNVFLEVVSKLLQHDQISMRKKAMDLLSSKLQHIDTGALQGKQLENLLSLVDMLLEVIRSDEGEDESEADHAIMRQFALFNMKILCKMIGYDNQTHFAKVFPAVVTLISDGSTPTQVLGNCLLCLAELVTSLKVKAISHLNTFMPPLLRILGKLETLRSNELLLLCTLTALQKVLASLPHFLSPFLLDVLVLVSQVSCFVNIEGESTKKSQPVMRLKAVRQHIATDMPTRVLVPVVSEAYSILLQQNQLGISCLLSILQAHTSHMTREDLTANQSALLSFYCKALDLRSNTGGKIPYSKVQEIEGETVEAVVAMVIRLTELSFRPMFYRLHDWACGDNTPLYRQRKLSYFRLCDKMSEKLRSLFNIFVTHSLKVACQTLEANNTSTNTDGTSYYEGVDGPSHSVELVQYTLSMLHNCLQYDTEGFVTKEVFTTLMQPLVNQLENFQTSGDIFIDHVTKSVVPCIGQLAVSARDDTAWKSLNYAVCLKTKDSVPKVRFAALKVLEEVAVKLGDEYMSLLPESIPFLAELMEDESEEVEQQCHHLVSKLEELLGESLQNYF